MNAKVLVGHVEKKRDLYAVEGDLQLELAEK